MASYRSFENGLLPRQQQMMDGQTSFFSDLLKPQNASAFDSTMKVSTSVVVSVLTSGFAVANVVDVVDSLQPIAPMNIGWTGWKNA
jgi:hypothetical protein